MKTIRELMPEDFTMILAAELNTHPANVSKVVKLEQTQSRYWPAIERLAKKTDPKGYEKRFKYLQSKKTAKAAA